jgi:tripartite motif-containing protein 71
LCVLILEDFFNLPDLCPFAVWDNNGITIANESCLGTDPYGIFVNNADQIYTTAKSDNKLLVLNGLDGSIIKQINGTFNTTFGIFVTESEDIYVDNGRTGGQLELWRYDGLPATRIRSSSGPCYGLFVHKDSDIYCSMEEPAYVLRSVYNLPNRQYSTFIAAGNGSNGSTAQTLYMPRAIYLDTKQNLYVADAGNDRVQFFVRNNPVGTTLVGNGAPNTISLSRPTGLVLDKGWQMYIADTNHHRIVAGSPKNGFRCIIGCNGLSGSAANQLQSPQSLSFDSGGNLIVVDTGNHRIQKFSLVLNLCGMSSVERGHAEASILHVYLYR